MGTSGMTAASAQRLWGIGYSRSPAARSRVPARMVQFSPMRSTIGPSRTLRITSESTPT